MSGTNRGLFPQLLKRPFDTAATHTNEFSNSISDLPSRDHVGASVGASAAAGLWIKKMKTFFFFPAQRPVNIRHACLNFKAKTMQNKHSERTEISLITDLSLRGRDGSAVESVTFINSLDGELHSWRQSHCFQHPA